MDRRAFLATLAGGLLAAPPAVRAQPAGKVYRIGLFHVGPDHVPPSLPTFRTSMKALGYEEGRNVQLDWRNLADETAAYEAAIAFVRDRVDVIVAFETLTVRAAMKATADIPVVFVTADDPLANGFVKSLAHPGGNVTGFANATGLSAKTVEIFKELMPSLQRLLILVDPRDPETPAALAEVQTAARRLKFALVRRDASSASELDRIFGTLRQGEVDGAFAVSPYLLSRSSAQLVRLAKTKRLPLAVHRKGWVEQGALFSYRHDVGPVGVSAARYVDRILKGATPGDLPVEQPTTFELVINVKTAKALGLTIPPSLLQRADQVIE
jgi:putative ABC transport system substrate-binding protein